MTDRFTLLRALLDRAHPARRQYERFRATPEQAAEAVQAARAKLGATVQAGPPNQGPLTGIEVREPCPYCPAPAMIPRTLMAAHLREQHAPQMDALMRGEPEGRPTAAYQAAIREVLGDGPWDVIAHRATDAVIAVRDDELEQARHELDTAQRELETSEAARASLRRQRAVLRQAITRRTAARARVRALHQPRDYNGQTICGACSDYDPSSDSTDSAPVAHPCDTIRALDGTQQPEPKPWRPIQGSGYTPAQLLGVDEDDEDEPEADRA